MCRGGFDVEYRFHKSTFIFAGNLIVQTRLYVSDIASVALMGSFGSPFFSDWLKLDCNWRGVPVGCRAVRFKMRSENNNGVKR